MDFIVGGLAAMAAGIFSNPFDVVKTRMQLQGELRARGQHAVYYRNAFHAAYVIGKNEGILALQKGLITVLALHGVRNCIRLGSYQWLCKNDYLCDDGGKTIFYRSFLASGVAGAAGAFVGSPLFLIKIQLQSQANQTIAVGYQHGHSGLIGAFLYIYKEHGIRGLWRGWSGTVVRAIAGSSAQLTSFSATKDYLKENSEFFNHSPILTSFAASMVGGVFQTMTMTPFDLVTTRLYNQGTDAKGKGLLYDGIIDCFIKIWKAEGFYGFYKGVGANYLRIAPHGALSLIFWDILKDLQAKYFS